MARQKVSQNPNPNPNPSIKPSAEQVFTQENFEKELKNLATKAQDETWARWTMDQGWIILQTGTLYTLAAISSNVSVLNMSPVYGMIPSKRWHSQGIWICCFFGWSLGFFLRRWLPVKPQQLLPIIAAYIPLIHFYLFKLSNILGATYGPVITEALTFFPLLIISISVAANLLNDLDLKWKWIPSWISDSFPGILSFSFYKTIEFLAASKIQTSIGSSFLQTRLGLQVVLTSVYSIILPSKLLLYILPALLHIAFLNTHVQSSFSTNLLNSTLAKSGWSLLDRRESVTGYLSVLENHDKNFRVMRCDHSLLGGEWLTQVKTRGVLEPVYGVFVMLEAVRLVEVKNPVPDLEAKAYVVGLGVGTIPAALIEHGINTTVVEIDSVVYDFAFKYFNLPKDHTPVIADAASFTAQLAQTDQRFDYVIHDVFTGGAEPVDLFTLEFIQDLSSILKPDGVIAINYAGDLSLPNARIVVQTIQTVFPTCRMFRETQAPSSSKITADGGRDFDNMVIFCTNAAREVRFREPTESDLLNSGARQQFLVPKNEVHFSELAESSESELLRRNNTENMIKWQEKSSLGHWYLMRTVFPPEIWEMW